MAGGTVRKIGFGRGMSWERSAAYRILEGGLGVGWSDIAIRSPCGGCLTSRIARGGRDGIFREGRQDAGKWYAQGESNPSLHRERVAS
jgi:hypothetical protein